MNIFDIRTTLSLTPTPVNTTHDITCITRGATAAITFDLSPKVYSIAEIDQLIFLFKQGNILHKYQMYSYIKPTTDEVVDPNKTYYTNVTAIGPETLQHTGIKLEFPSGNPKEQAFWEEIEGDLSWRDTSYIVNPYFTHSTGDFWEYITLALSSEDTRKFKPTPEYCEKLVSFEVAVRLNTDSFANLGGRDSIIIEPQHPIAVVDSLYGNLYT